MKPAAFDYYRPRTLDEALSLLMEHGSDAKPLAGGQSLIPAMNFRLATPAVLIDLNALNTLDYLKQEADGLHVGSMTRQRTVERSALAAKAAPLMIETLPFVAHVAIRNRGTIGGSLAHADPAAELPAVMLALDAKFRLRSNARSRTVAADDFLVGLFTTAIEPGELLAEVIIPNPAPRTGFAFREISRRHGDFALAGVAVAVTVDGDGRCSTARIALLSVGDRAMVAQLAAQALIGQTPSVEAIRAAADAAAQEIDPPSDIHASAKYRRQLVNVLTRRALAQAFDGAGKRDEG
jgi:carbon-monoxide dehydrogenase medium subunit